MDLSKGGYKIIDITSLPLSEVTEADDITDVKILKQLLSLSEYALHPDRKLKPIYLRSIDEDGVENVAMAELDRNSGSMRILALINLMLLAISVSYSVDADTQEVSIDTATYVCVKDETRMVGVVTDLVKGGTLDNAKPIYCHPIAINIANDDTIGARLTMLVFNNDPTPFTLSTLEQWIKDLHAEVGDTMRIMVSGAGHLAVKDVDIIFSFLGYSLSNKFYIVGYDTANSVNKTESGGDSIVDLFNGTLLSFFDGVNKIN